MSLESEQPPRRRGEKIKEIGLLFSLDSFGSDPSDAGTFLELGSGALGWLDAKIVLFWSSIVWPFVESWALLLYDMGHICSGPLTDGFVFSFFLEITKLVYS